MNVPETSVTGQSENWLDVHCEAGICVLSDTEHEGARCESSCHSSCPECLLKHKVRRCEFPAKHKGHHRCTQGHYW